MPRLRPVHLAKLAALSALTGPLACSILSDPDSLKGGDGGASQAGDGGGSGRAGDAGRAGNNAGGDGGAAGRAGAGAAGQAGMGAAGQAGAGAAGASGAAGQAGAGGGAPRTYAELVLSDGPVAYYRFDDAASGEVASVVGGPTGTVQGAALQPVVGALVGDASTAARFAGSNVSLGDAFPFAPASPFTFEVWFKPDAPLSTGFPKVFAKYARESTSTNAYEGYYFLVRDEGASFSFEPVGSASIYSVSSGLVPTDEFTHAAVTSDGVTGMQLYINGESVGTVMAPLAAAGAGATFLLGEGPDTEPFRGAIDEFAVYDKALPAAAIAAHYARGRSGPQLASRQLGGAPACQVR